MSEVNKETNVAVTTKNEVVKAGAFDVKQELETFKKAMEEDCMGLDFQFQRVILPTGGGTMFQVPSADSNEPVMEKEIVGVIINNHPANSYYKDKFNGQNNPPDCYSLDGIKGVGTPGCECKTCPYNEFNTAENGGKACKNKRLLYILREGELFPIVVYLPVGSVSAFTKFSTLNASKGKFVSKFVTKITLKKAQNSTGIAYSQAEFEKVRDLTPEEIDAIAPIKDFIKAYEEKREKTIVDEVAKDDPLPFGDENK